MGIPLRWVGSCATAAMSWRAIRGALIGNATPHGGRVAGEGWRVIRELIKVLCKIPSRRGELEGFWLDNNRREMAMSANWIYVFRAADQISVFVLLLVYASLAAARPLDDLAKTADLIVVGSAVSVSGAVPDSTIVVGVDRVLKGSYSDTTILARIEGRRLSGHVPRDVRGV